MAAGTCYATRTARTRPHLPHRPHRARPAAPHAFDPPAGLDPVAALEENLGTGWEYQTRVVFDAPLEDVAPWIRPPMGRLEPLGDGCVLVGSTSNPAMYARSGWPACPSLSASRADRTPRRGADARPTFCRRPWPDRP